MKKSEKFDYMTKKLRLISHSDFLTFISESPLNEKDKNFVIDIKNGLSLAELAQKNGVTYSRVSQKKREIYELLYEWEKNCIDIIQKPESKKIDIEKLVSEKVSQALSEKTKQIEEKEALLDSFLEKEEKKRIQKKLRKMDRQLNSRGTKKSEPILIVKDDFIKSESEKITITKKDLKKKYLPMYARGEISSKEVCNILGITKQYLSSMKTEYLRKGEDYFNDHKGHVGNIPKNKTPEEISERICSLYKEKYDFRSLKEFVIDLEEIYKIKIAISTVKKILEEKGLYCRNSDRFIGISNEQIGTDFLSIITLIDKAIKKNELSEIEQFGLIELCELAFSKTYLTLNSFSKKLENTNYRTSYSCISHYVEEKYINIQEEWNYWNKNHEHFSYIYNEQYRKKVISDIRNVYYKMFKEIEKYVKSAREKLA